MTCNKEFILEMIGKLFLDGWYFRFSVSNLTYNYWRCKNQFLIVMVFSYGNKFIAKLLASHGTFPIFPEMQNPS